MRVAAPPASTCSAGADGPVCRRCRPASPRAQLVAKLEQDPRVVAYAKNDRLFLEVPYRWQGISARYRPDFIVWLIDGRMLLVEGKGRKTERDDSKHHAARRWRDAVNDWGAMGRWEFAIARSTADVTTILDDLNPEAGQQALS
ncbi:MAG TPA: hypothetical protein VGV57_01150 [Thermoleophilaceae bacterium]|nr:hypothetical protein [Thermoleophilaceae bacterium]